MIILICLLKFIFIIVPTLLSVAILTLVERKVMGAIQIRRGPNVIGYGFFQPLADGLKLLIKELIIPLKGNKMLFLFSPVLFLSLSFSIWCVIPFETFVVASPNLAILVFLAFSSLSIYGILLGGWASNSRYAFLGCLRSASQMLSYELVLSLLVLLVCILAQSFNMIDIVRAQTNLWFIIPLAPFFLMFMIAVLAETNRAPFDLPEAEAELVAGYSVEFSSAPFAFYFIAEYCNLIIWAHVTVILFFGGWLPIPFLSFLPPFFSFALKSFFILFLFCWIRAALPRYRWDQLMYLAWRIFLPIILIANFMLLSSYWFLVDLPSVELYANLSPVISITIPHSESLLTFAIGDELTVMDAQLINDYIRQVFPLNGARYGLGNILTDNDIAFFRMLDWYKDSLEIAAKALLKD